MASHADAWQCRRSCRKNLQSGESPSCYAHTHRLQAHSAILPCTRQRPKQRGKAPAVISSKSGPVVVHALALAVFHRWVTCSLPAISKYHFSSKVTYCTFPCTLILVNSLHVISSSSNRVRSEDFSRRLTLYTLP